MCVHGLNAGVIARGTAGGREPVVLFFAVDIPGIGWLHMQQCETAFNFDKYIENS